jgi:hypothetical protein
MASVIEITPRAPRLSMISGPMRFNKVVVTVDGAAHVGAWDQPTRIEVPAGTHRVDVHVQALLSPQNYVASMHVSVEAGETARLEYRVPATLVGVLKNGFNKGSLTAVG